MAEEWDRPGWNYGDISEYAELTTQKEWDQEAVKEPVPEVEYLLEQNDGLTYRDSKYFRDKFDERVELEG